MTHHTATSKQKKTTNKTHTHTKKWTKQNKQITQDIKGDNLNKNTHNNIKLLLR